MDFQNEFNHLQEMINLRNLNQDPPVDLYDLKGSDKRDNKIDSLTMEPFDTFLIGDKFISTNPKRENEEFIKSSVDDLVPIPWELEVNLVYGDLEYSMPIDPPSPRLDVLGDRKVDIDLLFGEHIDTLSMEDREIDFNPKYIKTNDLIPVPWVFNEPLVIDESSLLVTPLPDSKEISLKEVERLDPFFSLTQSGEETMVMEIPSLGFHHMPSPRPAAYSPKWSGCLEMVHGDPPLLTVVGHLDRWSGGGFGTVSCHVYEVISMTGRLRGTVACSGSELIIGLAEKSFKKACGE
nr:NAC domain-containing protein [Tanacetum cinerariifolium]